MKSAEKKNSVLLPWLGGSLIVLGVVIAVELFLKTGWLLLALLPAYGLILFAAGFRRKSMTWLLPGVLLTGLGVGLFLGYSPLFKLSWEHQLGAFLIAFSAGWIAITLIPLLFHREPAWGALIPAGVIGGTGIVFAFTSLRFLDFVLYPSIGLGLAFLLWGYFDRLLGLIIAGSLVITTGPAVFMGWIKPGQALTQTGVMLVVLAFGWFLITFFTRARMHKLVWWPLIPGGILAMVGWGLYIGGSPGTAVNFIGNTGSIVLIILGIYLLLVRRGMRQ